VTELARPLDENGRPRSLASLVAGNRQAGGAWERRQAIEARLAGDPAPPQPPAAHARIAQLATVAGVPIRELNDDTLRWAEVCLLLHLHALADLACADLGVAGAVGTTPFYYLEASKLLSGINGAPSLSTFARERVRVLPKTRTPQSGITLRSLSHHVAADQCEVDVTWLQSKNRKEVDDLMRLRVLLFPWPFTVAPGDFFPEDGPALDSMHKGKFGFFAYAPKYDPRKLAQAFDVTLRRARLVIGDDIDCVILPECAIDEEEFDTLWGLAERAGVQVFLAGVRATNDKKGGRGRSNSARLRIKNHPSPAPFEQEKHHRWFLERSQITTYGLLHVLNPARRWWESMTVGRRTLNVVSCFTTSSTPCGRRRRGGRGSSKRRRRGSRPTASTCAPSTRCAA
jgi:hypothetical protein